MIDEELARAGLSRPDLVIGGWAGLAVVQHGSAGQQERFARAHAARRDHLVPAVQRAGGRLGPGRAARPGPSGCRDGAGRPRGWRLTGQKVWTSLAHEADWAICLARTDPAVPKHRGLTFFLVDMRSDGIEHPAAAGDHRPGVFNEVFLDERVRP